MEEGERRLRERRVAELWGKKHRDREENGSGAHGDKQAGLRGQRDGEEDGEKEPERKN